VDTVPNPNTDPNLNPIANSNPIPNANSIPNPNLNRYYILTVLYPVLWRVVRYHPLLTLTVNPKRYRKPTLDPKRHRQ